MLRTLHAQVISLVYISGVRPARISAGLYFSELSRRAACIALGLNHFMSVASQLVFKGRRRRSSFWTLVSSTAYQLCPLPLREL